MDYSDEDVRAAKRLMDMVLENQLKHLEGDAKRLARKFVVAELYRKGGDYNNGDEFASAIVKECRRFQGEPQGEE